MTNEDAQATEQLKQYMGGDEFARLCGIELVSAAPGQARAKMVLGPQHRNGYGVTQGGAIFTLADFAFAAASNAHGTVAVAINVNITFMKAAKAGTLWAEAKENSRNPRLGSYTIEVKDDPGELIAVFQGLVYRKKDPLPLDSASPGVTLS
jgi:acyl-CoA thioesterase